MSKPLRVDPGKPEIRKVLSDERRDKVSKCITVQTDQGAMNIKTNGKTLVETVNDYSTGAKSGKTKLYKSPLDALKKSEKGQL